MKKLSRKNQFPFLITCLTILLYGPLFAQKDDTLRLDNGDRITGEIKKVEHGIMNFKTSDMGTLNIEWNKIESIQSKKFFEIYLNDNTKYFGQIDSSFAESARIQLLKRMQGITNYLDLISKVNPIKQRFLDRLDIDLELGFQYNKGSDVSTLNTGYNFYYRSLRHGLRLKGDNYITDQRTEDQEFRKQDITLTYIHYMRKSWTLSVLTSAQQNTELGMDLRALFGTTAGKLILQTARMDLGLAGGLSANQETSTDGSVTNNLEVVFGTEFQLFKFHNPEIKVILDFTIFPSLTVKDRLRSVGNVKTKIEVFKDLYFNLTFYESFDSDPPDITASNNDFGITTGISYSF